MDDHQSAVPTMRLYLEDHHLFEADAMLVAVDGSEAAFDRTCFYPGGGGQPPDSGVARIEGLGAVDITSTRADENGVIWHACARTLPPALVGSRARLELDRARRIALMRYHTVLHILNAVAWKDYGGWITGVQISTDYSRIDFKLEGLSPALCAEMETKVNAVLARDLPVTSCAVTVGEFNSRQDLIRTLDVKPPVSGGKVLVVEIVGFDAQACGGTHVARTSEVGRFSIFKTENKGRVNKRLYVRLD
jgi:misacylated tRNA(Ala) deacylase